VASRRTSEIVVVAGARPNFIKIWPLLGALERSPLGRPRLLHTGQHYDAAMSDAFFRDLELPPPDVFLNIGAGTHAAQTARTMLAFEEHLERTPARLVIVVGDVNSTLACALTAAKMGVAVAHVEAGLRSYDREMPEEINRVVVDHLAELLFTPSPDADDNLLREGIAAARIHFVGNVMMDTLQAHLQRARDRWPQQSAGLGLREHEYLLGTFHRPENVDRREALVKLVGILRDAARRLPVVLPLHPRTRGRLAGFGLLQELDETDGIRAIPPLGYLDFVCLMDRARVCLTDSGGVQEETTFLGTPCLTLRRNTERPVTVTCGTNVVTGLDRDRVLDGIERALSGRHPQGRTPEKWDGRAAERIAEVLAARLDA
jgi:UDP-N-acetylglucosamine 2-epimerase (non-hydrolysing)